MKTLNKHVAVEPIVLDSDKKTQVRGIDLSDRMVTKLIPTKVVFDSESFRANGTVFVRSDIVNSAIVRQKMELNGKVFILIPEELVLAYEFNRTDITNEVP